MSVSHLVGLVGSFRRRGRLWQPRSVQWAAIAACMAALLTTLASPARAQFAQDEPKLTERDVRAVSAKVNKLISSGASALSPDDEKVVNEFLVGYLFPVMSRQDPFALGQLAKIRESLFRSYINRAKSPALRKYLVDTTLSGMARLASGNYHPSVRYNAVLVIAALDAEPAGRGAGAKPAVPLPQATKALIHLLEQDAINKVRVPSSVKVGALVGLKRHARLGIDAQNKAALQSLALKVAKSSAVPNDVSPEVYGWMKCQAAGVLAYLHAASADAETHAAILGLMADKGLSLDDRCHAARLLAVMKYPGAGAIDVAATINQLADLTQSVCASEGDKAAEVDKKMVESADMSTVGRGYGEGGMGGGGAYGAASFDSLSMTEEGNPQYEKRRMLRYVDSLLVAGKAIQPILGEEEKTRAAALLTLLATSAEKVANKKTLDAEIPKTVMNLRDEVDSLIKSWKPNEPQPATNEDAEAAFGQS